MARIFLAVAGLFLMIAVNAQEQHPLKLNSGQIEDMFINNNLELIAGQLNIDIADAAVVQAKLLNNPSLSVSQFNFWNKNAAEELGYPSPAPFSKNVQFSIELEQLIRTAGKRRKLVNVEKASKEIAITEFENLLLNLKTELRKNINETIYIQSYKQIIERQQESINQLISSYKKQTESGNISKNELLRLQSSVIEMEAETNELQAQLNSRYKELKVLLNIQPGTEIQIIPDQQEPKDPGTISIMELIEIAHNQRPDLLLSGLYVTYNEKLLDYEKSFRVPDLALSANYDRYGGVWKDFVGIGVSIDIPFFNRNQGNIKAARLSLQQSNLNVQYQENLLAQEIIELFDNYKINYNFYKKITSSDFTNDLDSMLEVYSRNLINKNISMVEFIDFMDAYKTTRQTILNARKNLFISFDELQSSINNEIK